VRLRVSERAKARLLLTRSGAKLIERRGWVLPGVNTLHVRIPAPVGKGEYDLTLALADATRRRLALHGGVLVPALSRRDACLGTTTCVYVSVGASAPESAHYDDGTGEVTSSPAGIDCRFFLGQPDGLSICGAYIRSFSRPSVDVALTLRPDVSSYVGQCPDEAYSGASRPCNKTYTISNCKDDPCYFTYDFLLRRFSLKLTRDGFGVGHVVAYGSRTFPTWRRSIDCRKRSCTLAAVPYGTTFKVRGEPNDGSAFLHWSGACANQRNLCALTITQDTSTNATFVRTLPPRP